MAKKVKSTKPDTYIDLNDHMLNVCIAMYMTGMDQVRLMLIRERRNYCSRDRRIVDRILKMPTLELKFTVMNAGRQAIGLPLLARHW